MSELQVAERVKRNRIACGERIFIDNVELVDDRLVRFINGVLELDLLADADVFGCVFYENKPLNEQDMPTFAKFSPLFKSFAVNLQHHWDEAVANAKSGKNHMRIDYLLWFNLVVTILHELKHCIEINQVNGDIEAFKALPNEAQDWAFEALFTIAASGFDVEPHTIEKDPFFGSKMADITDIIMDEKEDWHKTQLDLMTLDICAKNGDLECKTFTDWLKSNDSQEDRVWYTETTIEEDMERLIEGTESIEITPQNISGDSGILPEPHTVVTDVPDVKPTIAVTMPQGTGKTDEQIDTYSYLPQDEPVDDDGTTINMAYTPQPTPAVATAPATPQAVAIQPIASTHQAPPVNAAKAGVMVAPPKLAPEQIQQVMDQLYYRLFAEMFNKCGFQPGSDVGFTNPMGILDPVYVGDIPGISEVLISYDTYDAMGQAQINMPVFHTSADPRTAHLPDGHIKGALSKERMPAFIIHINVNGEIQKRNIRPQNCNKVKAGTNQRAPWALEAYNGVRRVNIYRDLSPAEISAGAKPMVCTITNIPGQSISTLTYNPLSQTHQRVITM